MPQHKLVIAEKPSVARAIAAVLGANTKKDGYLEGGGYIVSWCVGHLVELAQADAYGEQYAKWRYADLTVLPDVVKSPALTAEWEAKLKQVERGELEAGAFMEGIAAMTRDLVKTYDKVLDEHKGLFAPPQGEAVGVCPRCGQQVRESKKGFFCESRDCAFALWKDNRFFAAKKKTLTKAIAAALLTEGLSGS